MNKNRNRDLRSEIERKHSKRVIPWCMKFIRLLNSERNKAKL